MSWLVTPNRLACVCASGSASFSVSGGKVTCSVASDQSLFLNSLSVFFVPTIFPQYSVMLCDICKHVISMVLREELPRNDAYSPPRDVRDLDNLPQTTQTEAFRVDQCLICRSLESVVERFSMSPRYLGLAPNDYLELLFCGQDGNSMCTDFTIQPADPAIYAISKPLDLAASWYHSCLQHHRKCKGRQTTEWYPTRLLSISTANVRLIQTSEEFLEGPYATLSHCWGSERLTFMTAENKVDFEAGIPLASLPSIFQDAILTVRGLEIRHIWIDCYCIIQDSETDKSFEISRMKDVYANAMLNIGATGDLAATEDWTSERYVRRSSRECFFLSGVRDGQDQLYQIYNPYLVYDDSRYLRQRPLFRRAWILQERILSKRMLYLTNNGLYWECNEQPFMTETFPCGAYCGSHQPPPTEFSIDDNDSIRSKTDIWLNLVQEYSAMSLSFPTEDKFNAIAALAERLADEQLGRYVAGFFEKDLVWALSWTSLNTGKTAVKEWRAPSWSWAVTNKQVNFPSLFLIKDHFFNMVTIKEIHVEACDTSNPYGPLKSASLKISGRLMAVIVQCEEPGLDQILYISVKIKEDHGPWAGVLDAPWHTSPGFSSQVYILPLFGRRGLDEYRDYVCTILVEQLPSGEYIRRGAILAADSGKSDRMRALWDEWISKEEEVITLV